VVVAGLTGGIATGKSTVARFLAECGAQIIDADLIAHAVVRKGLPAWQRIVEHFGERILRPDGEINRERLGDIVFADKDAKEVLNGIVHPEVFGEMGRQLSLIERDRPEALAIMDVPLLIEAGMERAFSEVILVYVPPEIQLRRLMERDGLAEAAARARIDAQMPIEEKRRHASIVIDNSASLDATRASTFRVFHRLCKSKSVSSVFSGN